MPKNPHAVALGKQGGRSTSPEKQQAARANGKKGGRPKTMLVEFKKIALPLGDHWRIFIDGKLRATYRTKREAIAGAREWKMSH